jgi:hypothetical protein
MDGLHRHLFNVLMERKCNHGAAAAVDVTLLSRYYERFPITRLRIKLSMTTLYGVPVLSVSLRSGAVGLTVL